MRQRSDQEFRAAVPEKLRDHIPAIGSHHYECIFPGKDIIKQTGNRFTPQCAELYMCVMTVQPFFKPGQLPVL